MSGAALSESGHLWVGCDLSSDMLRLAQGSGAEVVSTHNSLSQGNGMPFVPLLSSRTGYNKLNHKRPSPEVAAPQPGAGKGLVFQCDMAQGIPLKADSIDGAVSISAVQWLCHLPNPKIALSRLFRGLYRCLKLGCKAVMQVYLAGNSQVDLLLTAATAEGFSGGLYVGFPHRGLAKKYFLCLSKGSSPTLEGQVWGQACPLALPVQCGCTWQWLQRTVPTGQDDSMASAAAIHSASAEASSALSGAASAAVRDSTADPGLSASTAAASAVAVTSNDSSLAAADSGPASRLQSAPRNKAALPSQANPSAEATLLVEAIVPDEKLCTNSCHMPCVFNILVADPALSSCCCRSELQTNASVTALEGTEAQRQFIEMLVRQHLQTKDFGLNVDAHIQLSSSIKRAPASPVVPPGGISHKAKKVRTGKEDETELTAFASLGESQQRLPQALVLSKLADDDKDCSVQGVA
ncbi:hypothetical protein ABBQ32_002718 [Trebouxia sp. C0010 RCD-2024]